jgi:cytochrome o ubiquinol oxidase subunit 2
VALPLRLRRVTKNHIISGGRLMFLASHQIQSTGIMQARDVTGKRSLFVVCLTILVAPLLGGCDWVVMQPSGDIAVQQRDLIVISTILMLLIIIPVMALTLFFAWKYRSSNTNADYAPDWDHSARLEIIIWSAPLAIIIALGTITWISTHKLDPYRPLDRLDESRLIPAGTKPLTVEVVALDWKWLFIYPDYGVATINELAAPVDVPINFKITSSSMMNSFYVPALAGQVYAMTGMETKLHAVINKEGVYKGFSANYSGAGFSHMYFNFLGQSQEQFNAWIEKARAGGTTLGRKEYLEIEKPSVKEAVRYYGKTDQALYNAILNMCADPSKMCMSEMMHIDMRGGAGVESHANKERLEYDSRRASEPPAAGHKEGGTHSDKTDIPDGNLEIEQPAGHDHH